MFSFIQLFALNNYVFDFLEEINDQEVIEGPGARIGNPW